MNLPFKDYPLFRRRNYVVNKEFQLKYAIWNASWLLIFAILLGFLIFYPLYVEISNAVSTEQERELYRTFLTLHETVWLPLAIILAGIFLTNIIMTHRVAGPVYRLRLTLADMAKGNFKKRIKFRKWDEFQDLAELCNQVSERVTAELSGSHGPNAAVLESVIADVESLYAIAQSNAGLPAEVRKKIQSIHEALGRVG